MSCLQVYTRYYRLFRSVFSTSSDQYCHLCSIFNLYKFFNYSHIGRSNQHKYYFTNLFRLHPTITLFLTHTTKRMFGLKFLQKQPKSCFHKIELLYKILMCKRIFENDQTCHETKFTLQTWSSPNQKQNITVGFCK